MALESAWPTLRPSSKARLFWRTPSSRRAVSTVAARAASSSRQSALLTFCVQGTPSHASGASTCQWWNTNTNSERIPARCAVSPPAAAPPASPALFASCLQDIHTCQTQQYEALHLKALLFNVLCVPVPPDLRVCNICCAKVIIASDRSPGMRRHTPAAAVQAQVHRSTLV